MFYVSIAKQPSQVFSRNDGNVKGVKSNNKSNKHVRMTHTGK
jgi:hypothetical protein